MKKFHFKLEKVLQYKKSIEDKKKAKLGNIISEYNKVKNTMDKANHNRDQILDDIKDKFSDFTYLKLVKHSLQGIQQTFINGNKQLDEIQLRINNARQEYIKAKQEHDAYEKLKEKKYEKWKYEVKKEQQKIQEEVALQLWRTGKLKEYEIT